MTANSDAIEEGLQAWMAGDLDALERLLDPHATLHADEPGPWDCNGRAQIMSLLRRRQAEQPNKPRGAVRITRLADDSYVVSSAVAHAAGAEPSPTTTRITVDNGKVIAMQQHRPADPVTVRRTP